MIMGETNERVNTKRKRKYNAMCANITMSNNNIILMSLILRNFWSEIFIEKLQNFDMPEACQFRQKNSF